MKYILSTLLLTGFLSTAAFQSNGFATSNGPSPDRNDLSGDTVQLPVSGEGCVATPETKDVPFSQLMYSKSHGHP